MFILNCVLSFAHRTVDEAGLPSTANTFANWTSYKNGFMVRVDTCNGLFIENSFSFCCRKGIEVYCQNARAPIGSPGQLQFLHVSNTLFDGSPQMLHVTGGGWITTATLTGVPATCINADAFNNSGTYPDQIKINSAVTQNGQLLLSGCHFSGVAGPLHLDR